jgi:hypothetical protein
MAGRATARLLDLIEGVASDEDLVVELRLVEGGSSGPPPG